MMSDNVQVDKHELMALLERILFITKDEQTCLMARQMLHKTFSPVANIDYVWAGEGYQPTHSNLGEPPQDD